MNMEIVLVLGVVLCVFMLADLNRMEDEMEQDRIRQDMIFKSFDAYIEKHLKKDQKKFVSKGKHGED